MSRILVAFEGENSRQRIKSMLESGGISVRSTCSSGSEVLRMVELMEDSIVICGFKLGDMTAEHMAHILRDKAMFLVIASSAQLDLCDSEDLFKLASPVTKGDLLASVRILMQIGNRLLHRPPSPPRRSAEEERIIEEAKRLLINRHMMTEEEAHRFLQKKSMDAGAKMADTARIILNI